MLYNLVSPLYMYMIYGGKILWRMLRYFVLCGFAKVAETMTMLEEFPWKLRFRFSLIPIKGVHTNI